MTDYIHQTVHPYYMTCAVSVCEHLQSTPGIDVRKLV